MPRETTLFQLRTSAVALMVLTAVHAAAQPVRIATGSDPILDGYLDVAPDEFGSWAQPFAGAGSQR